MNLTVSTITVLFDEPFWTVLYEREHSGGYEICKIVFGAEPKDYEVYGFLLRNYHSLKFSRAVSVSEKKAPDKVNPKRMQRLVKKQLESTGIGTKAQKALSQSREMLSQERKKLKKEARQEQLDTLFEKKQQKKKEKHRGH